MLTSTPVPTPESQACASRGRHLPPAGMRRDSAPWACPSAPGAVECETGVPRPSGRCARLRAKDANGRRPPTRQALRVGEAQASVPSALALKVKRLSLQQCCSQHTGNQQEGRERLQWQKRELCGQGSGHQLRSEAPTPNGSDLAECWLGPLLCQPPMGPPALNPEPQSLGLFPADLLSSWPRDCT